MEGYPAPGISLPENRHELEAHDADSRATCGSALVRNQLAARDALPPVFGRAG